MGWLRKMRDAAVKRGLRDAHFEHDVEMWKLWAFERGWTYQAEAPELVGRYAPEYSRGLELYHHLLTTQLHGLRTIAFEHRTSSWEQASPQSEGSIIRRVRAFVVIQLPGRPPEEFVKMGPGKAIRKLGGTVPTGHDLKLVGDELVAQRDRGLDPISLAGDSELLALQIIAVPPLSGIAGSLGIYGALNGNSEACNALDWRPTAPGGKFREAPVGIEHRRLVVRP